MYMGATGAFGRTPKCTEDTPAFPREPAYRTEPEPVVRELSPCPCLPGHARCRGHRPVLISPDGAWLLLMLLA